MSLEIKESITNKKENLFNIKRFRYGTLNTNNNIKTIDTRHFTNSDLEFLKNKWNRKEIVFEQPKFIGSIDVINNLLSKDRDATYQSRFFGKRSEFSSFMWSMPITLKLKSINEVSSFQNNTNFFDLYYAHSDFLLIPNIVPNYYVESGGKNPTKVNLLNSEKYIEYVDSVYEILNYKNNKPIFVPLTPRFSILENEEIIKHYVKKNHLYFWIDFDGSYVKENFITLARQLSRVLDTNKRFDDSLIYSANIKREIISHPTDIETPSSDIMSPLIGSNILGSNREPRKYIPNDGKLHKPKYSNEQFHLHKDRKFVSDTYLYKIQKPTTSEPKNSLQNNLNLYKELIKQCENFSVGKLESYVSNKKAFENEKAKKLLKCIFDIKKQPRLDKWF